MTDLKQEENSIQHLWIIQKEICGLTLSACEYGRYQPNPSDMYWLVLRLHANADRSSSTCDDITLHQHVNVVVGLITNLARPKTPLHRC